MKTFLQTLLGSALLCLASISFAQTSTAENFTSTPVGQVPAGWATAANTDVTVYQRPGSCTVNDKGLGTPGVGKNAPTGFVLPVTTFNTNSNDIKIDFSVYVFDANLRCSSSKPFPCPTYVKAYIVPEAWNDPLGTPLAPSTTIPLSPPTTLSYYAAQENYQILYANTSNTIIFQNVSLPAGVTKYRILLNFKTADGSNCSSTGTKFVFDDFGVGTSNCTNCSPTSNADYFNADVQNLFSSSTTFKGNVYGGYAKWANEAPAGYSASSLKYSPASNNGTDYDLNNTDLSNTKFTLSSPLAIETSSGCTASPSAGTLVLNADGTFSYTKGSACVTRVSFSYTLTTYANPGLNIAFGTTPATKVTIDLPGVVVNLPVHFKSFNATRNGKQVLLQWVTATEQNNKGFYVQRSTDGGWKDIGLVFSQNEDGNSNSEIAYSFTDLNPSKGITQYRILQVDFDGKGRYSETRAVRGETSGSKVTLFPNPSSTGTVNLLFDAAGMKEVIVLDVTGQVIKQYKNITGSSLQLKSLQSGFYNVVVRDATAGTTTVEKLFVKKG